jgi:hypothetical protein
MSQLREVRILPPLAIARLGSADEPVNNYDLHVPPGQPLGYRVITPAPTLVIDEALGAIVARERRKVTFKDHQGQVRPVAPFLELWGRFDDSDDWRHLTMDDLPPRATIAWEVQLGNIKVFRRTGDPKDRVIANTGPITGHDRVPILGRADHFLPGKAIPFGDVRFIRPTAAFPHLRVRYTPARGYVYGADAFARNADGTYKTAGNYLAVDRNIRDVVYDAKRGTWLGYTESIPPNQPFDPALTVPPQIYAGQEGKTSTDWVSMGYLDDECDGVIAVKIESATGVLTAFARLGAGPPAYAPDSYPIRSVYDELEQAMLGPTIEPGDYTDDELQREAEEILRRAFETVRLMNTTIMNGNADKTGQVDIGSTMVRQDSNDAARAWQTIMAPTIVDNLAVQSLHQNIFTVLRSGAPPWFVSTLRQFDEIGDLTDLGRRKMPGMMRNADGRYLCLTRRQYDKIRAAASRLVARAAEGGKDSR